MNDSDFVSEIEQITDNLIKSQYKSCIDGSINAPVPFRGKGDIKIIILGQDPTVQNPEYRKKIKVTLLLNQPGGLRTYLGNICNGLSISLDKNVYATNLLKNFFTKTPDQIRIEDPDFLNRISAYWIPLLIQEIAEFPGIPVLTLGEPVLNCLMKTQNKVLIRNYWGYIGPAKYGEDYRWINAKENILNRTILPFPHIQGIQHKFYSSQMSRYIKFLKRSLDQPINSESSL
jgi:hypothetical protein